VDPEFVTAYEGGLKADLFQKLLTVNAAGFLNDYRDLQITTFDTSTNPARIVTSNAGHVQIYGFEVEVSARPVSGVRIQGSIGYQKSRFKSETYFADPFTGLPTLGRELAKSPKLTLSGIAQYEFALGSWTGRISTDWSYRGRTAGVPEGSNGVYAGLALPGGAIGNVALAIRPKEDLEVSVFINNVTNNNKLETSRFYNGNYADYTASANPLTKPRQAGVSASVKF